MGKFGKGLKEFLGIDPIEDEQDLDVEITGMEDFAEEQETVVEPKKELKLDDSLAKGLNEQPRKEEVNIEDCQQIFMDPRNFGDCKKIANYIKNERMVTLNLEYLDTETAQRMMDFLMGAMLIKGASFIEISKKVYTSVPKSVKVHYDGRKSVNDKMYMNTRED